jgi:hypothetical protein
MTQEHIPELAVPADLAAQLRAAAEEQHRAPVEVLHDALDQYLTAHRPANGAHRSPAEAAARIIARRKGITLGGLTIKQLINEGRP